MAALSLPLLDRHPNGQMQNFIDIEIASVHLYVCCRDAAILLDSDPSYSLFINPPKAPSSLKIEINLELENMPDTAALTKIFDSGQSWSLYQSGDAFYIVLEPPAFAGRPVWIACFKRPLDRVSVYCSDMLIQMKNGQPHVMNPVKYPLDQLVLMYALAETGGNLLHAAGININGRCCVFPGRSGAGKSTLSRQFLNRAGAELLSDDRIILRKIDDIFKAFGTPWPGDAGIAENINFPLSGMFFIRHANENMIKEIKPKEAIERLMPVTSIPWYDEKTMSDILSFCEDLVFNIPSYELHFKPDKEVVDLLEKFASA